MPDVQLSDRFGLTIDAKPNESSSFVKYFKSLTQLKFSELNANQLKIRQLSDLPVKAFSAGVSFEEPVDIGGDTTTLKVRAGVQASIQCLLASKGEKTKLFDSDLYGDPIDDPGWRRLSFAWHYGKCWRGAGGDVQDAFIRHGRRARDHSDTLSKVRRSQR